MTEQQEWAASRGYPSGGSGPWNFAPPPPGALPPPPADGGAMAQMRPPSGLFPGLPSRPVYREPHPIRSAPVFAGLAATVLWFALFGGLGRDLASYTWWTIVAAVAAWIVATVLALFGDRGAAVGIAIASGCGLSLALALVADQWITTYNWPLW